MGDDSQNKKRGSVEKAAFSASRDALMDTERKLREARRLFSLGDFVACEALLLQILEADPLSSKARALSELTAIKLHKRKLYRKLVEPRSVRKPQRPSTSSQTEETELPVEQSISPQAHSEHFLSEDASETVPSLHSMAEITSDTEAPGSDASSSLEESVPQIDTMRERTIAALVQLFEEKERKLEDWRDLRLGANPRETKEAAGSSAEISPDITEEDTGSLAIPWQSLGSAPEVQTLDKDSKVPSEAPAWLQHESAKIADRPQTEQAPSGSAEKAPTPSAIALPSLEIVEEIGQLKHEPVVPSEQYPLPENEQKPLSANIEKVQPLAKGKDQDSVLPSSPQSHPPRLRESKEAKPKVIQLPKVSPFEQITSPKKVDYGRLVERKLEQRSEDLKNSEIKTVSLAQIKKYLYKEEYELCTRELENIQKLFPDSAEIQAFVENTSKRLSELQRFKGFEILAKELMLSASFHYQQGKLPEALIATNEVLRVMPDHQQARQFAELVQKRLDKEKKKVLSVEKIRYCWACGVAVDSISQYCYHCGHRLT